MKITETKTNDYGQKTTIGTLQLKSDTKMENRINNGRSTWDPDWSKLANIIVPQGTKVDFVIQETRNGKYCTVTYRDGNNTWEAAKKMDGKNYGCRAPSID